jgi:hypothetical protein
MRVEHLTRDFAARSQKFAAAARIASAVIAGWPDAPGSPLHSGVPSAEGVAAGPVSTVPVVPPNENSDRRSKPCASAIATLEISAAAESTSMAGNLAISKSVTTCPTGLPTAADPFYRVLMGRK